MGHPAGAVWLPTGDPAADAALIALVESAPLDPLGLRHAFRQLLASTGPPRAQLCATAWVLSPSARRVLLVRHPRLGWSNPGGHVEAGEGPVAAAVRELQEETGLRLAPRWPGPVVLQRSGGDHEHWSLGFLFVTEPGAAPARSVEGAPVRWFATGRLPAERVGDLAPVVRVLVPWVRKLAPL